MRYDLTYHTQCAIHKGLTRHRHMAYATVILCLQVISQSDLPKSINQPITHQPSWSVWAGCISKFWHMKRWSSVLPGWQFVCYWYMLQWTMWLCVHEWRCLLCFLFDPIVSYVLFFTVAAALNIISQFTILFIITSGVTSGPPVHRHIKSICNSMIYIASQFHYIKPNTLMLRLLYTLNLKTTWWQQPSKSLRR